MGYLEKFARKRKTKERTEVLTARLPESLYNDFKDYCEELGLSISEAVYLLVEREMIGQVQGEPEVKEESPLQQKIHTSDDIKNDDVVVMNTNVVKEKVIRKASTTFARYRLCSFIPSILNNE